MVGYLHLVLLGVITLFLLGFMFTSGAFIINKSLVTGTFIFTGGIIINEILLMTQGVTALSYFSIPYMNEGLLATAIIMFSGLLILLIGQKLKPETDFNHN